jgi:shikimate kinase
MPKPSAPGSTEPESVVTARSTPFEGQHLVLVGMMGSGKTSVGRLAAERLHRPFVDTDALIEARTGRTVRQIFVEDGEAAFRDAEVDALADSLASAEPSVIAAAGGVVLRPENRAALKRARARVIWLCADPELLAERARSGGHRPLLDADPEGMLRTMWAERESLYRDAADAIVRVDGRTVYEVVEAVLR